MLSGITAVVVGHQHALRDFVGARVGRLPMGVRNFFRPSTHRTGKGMDIHRRNTIVVVTTCRARRPRGKREKHTTPGKAAICT